MMLEHQVWGTRPGREVAEFISAFSPERWQFALKAKRILEEQQNYSDVEIRDKDVKRRQNASET
jgi:hypothetical protein